MIDRAAILGGGRTLAVDVALGLGRPLPPPPPDADQATLYEVIPESVRPPGTFIPAGGWRRDRPSRRRDAAAHRAGARLHAGENRGATRCRRHPRHQPAHAPGADAEARHRSVALQGVTRAADASPPASTGDGGPWLERARRSLPATRPRHGRHDRCRPFTNGLSEIGTPLAPDVGVEPRISSA